jgi:hypothetical protein
MAVKKRLGEVLVEAGVIDDSQLRAALGYQRQWGMRLGQALVELGLASEADVVRALAQRFGYEVAAVGAAGGYGLEQALKLVPREFALKHNLLPLTADTGTITVAMSDPANVNVADELRFRTGRRVKITIGGDREIAEALRRVYPGGEVEPIALDLDAEDAGEVVLDPFGGGTEGEPAVPRPARAPPAPPPAPRTLLDDLDREVPPPGPPRAATPAGAIEPGFPPGEPILATDLAPAGEDPSALSPRELALLDALGRMAAGGPVEPELVKPAQAVAALLRLLLRKKIVTEEELAEELSRR